MAQRCKMLVSQHLNLQLFGILAIYAVPSQILTSKRYKEQPLHFIGRDPLPMVVLREMLKKKFSILAILSVGGCKGTMQSTPATVTSPDSSTALQVYLKYFQGRNQIFCHELSVLIN